MAKRPSFDLSSLTADAAEPMQEAIQRSAPQAVPTPSPTLLSKISTVAEPGPVATADLRPLAFKVPPEFDKRFRRTAFENGLKLNKLLYQALDAWVEKHGME